MVTSLDTTPLNVLAASPHTTPVNTLTSRITTAPLNVAASHHTTPPLDTFIPLNVLGTSPHTTPPGYLTSHDTTRQHGHFTSQRALLDTPALLLGRMGRMPSRLPWEVWPCRPAVGSRVSARRRAAGVWCSDGATARLAYTSTALPPSDSFRTKEHRASVVVHNDTGQSAAERRRLHIETVAVITLQIPEPHLCSLQHLNHQPMAVVVTETQHPVLCPPSDSDRATPCR
jgi:hypothetical protein